MSDSKMQHPRSKRKIICSVCRKEVIPGVHAIAYRYRLGRRGKMIFYNYRHLACALSEDDNERERGAAGKKAPDL